MKYTRKAFRKCLESLPDKPFCPIKICPIGYFMGIEKAMQAAQLDEDLAYLIDDISVCLPGVMDWSDLLPSQVLGIISELDIVPNSLSQE